ncbi:MAG: hypothetical protein KAK00_10795 [Nanoarchaeota archaeon]|nr:hypothetical protein [Nanoarchaeota archaeon]
MKKIIFILVLLVLISIVGCKIRTDECVCTDDTNEMCNPETNERRTTVPSTCTCGELNDVSKLIEAGWERCGKFD